MRHRGTREERTGSPQQGARHARVHSISSSIIEGLRVAFLSDAGFPACAP